MIILIFVLLGLIFGSFVNASVWRLHEQEALKGKKGAAAQKRRQALSISRGRSMCPHCEHELAAKDLVPVFSWLYLRGKCRYCRKPIADNPLVEVATGLLFGLSYAFWPLELHGVGLFMFIAWLGFLVAFVLLAVYDLRWFILPDKIVLPLAATAAAEVLVVAIWKHSLTAAWQPVVAAAIIFGLFWTLFQVSDGSWIGGGDVKLAITLGLLAGTPLQACLIIFVASLLGTIVSLPALVRGKKGFQARIPFGPYLLAATVIVVLFGAAIVRWYEAVLF